MFLGLSYTTQLHRMKSSSRLNRWSVGLQLYVTDASEINRWSVGYTYYLISDLFIVIMNIIKTSATGPSGRN